MNTQTDPRTANKQYLRAFVRRLRGLSVVQRWNFQPHIKEQNVAEHSYWVTMYAMILSDIHIAKNGANAVNPLAVVRHALVHDIEESITCDFPHLVKREMKDIYDILAHKAMDQLLDAYCTQGLPEFIKAGFWKRWEAEDYDPLVKKIVKAADLLDVYEYALAEETLGNKAFIRIKLETVDRLRKMELPCLNEYMNACGMEVVGVAMPEEMTHL